MDGDALGKRIKDLRERRRLSQPDLGLAVGVSGRTISNWENGRHVPRNSIGRLSDFFGVDIATEDVAGDPVEAAIRASELEAYRQAALIAEYQRHLHEQRREAAG